MHVAKETSSSITLEWTEPSSDGGEPIKAYIIEAKGPEDEEFRNVAKITGRDLCYTVGELSSNTEYEFAVRAENKAGESADIAILESPAKTKAKASELYSHTHVLVFHKNKQFSVFNSSDLKPLSKSVSVYCVL